ncbi:MAG TPA: formyltransferase family protein [Mycobacterium sp.]|nr:formyltransferase family protein [Mycobacterium sp.]
MKLLILADGAVGKRVFDWLAAEWLSDVSLLVTTGEGALKTEAERLGIPVVTFLSDAQVVRDCVELGVEPDLGLLAWWPKLIGTALLNLPVAGFVNTHPSLLPYNRGKHYNFWALVEQAPFGVSLHRVNAGVDSGEVVAQRVIPYGWEDTGKSLYEKAAEAMFDLVVDTYPTLRSLDFTSWPQPPGGSFHLASELEAASEIHLDQTYTGRELLNLLRARSFRPHPGCWFRDSGEEYEVRIEIGKRR